MNAGRVAGNILAVVNIAAPFAFFLFKSQWLWLVVAFQAVLCLWWFFRDFPVFARSYFWPLFLASLLALPWPLCFIAPLALYLAFNLLIPKLRMETTFLAVGKMSPKAWIFSVLTVIGSSGALVVWVIFARPDLSDLKRMVPFDSLPMLVLAGLLFSVFNAVWEETILKGILWDGAERFLGGATAIILFQAALFGLMHLNGFPRGAVGACLAGAYAVAIGALRKMTGGLAAPIAVHFFADATIFGILVWLRLSV